MITAIASDRNSWSIILIGTACHNRPTVSYLAFCGIADRPIDISA